MNRRLAVKIAASAAAILGISLVPSAAYGPGGYNPGPLCLPYGHPATSSYHPYFDQEVANGYVIDGDAWGLNSHDYNNDKICMADPNLIDGFAVERPTNVVKSAAFEGIAGYPNISQYPSPPIQVRRLGDTTASWSLRTDPAPSDSWDAALDMLYSPAPTAASARGDHRCNVEYPAGARNPEYWGGEVMIWLSSHDADNPAGSWLTDVSVDGVRYAVWRRPASSRSWTITSFIPMSMTTFVSNLDIGAFTRDAVILSHLSPSWYLCKISAGFEIWRGASGLATDSFSVKDVIGPPTGQITAGRAGMCLEGVDNRARSGDRVDISSCEVGKPGQQWAIEPDGSIRDLALGGHYCLSVPSIPAVGRDVTLKPCGINVGPSQQWLAEGGGLIESAVTYLDPHPLCWSASKGTAWELAVSPCESSKAGSVTQPDEHWTLPYNG